MIIKIRCNAKLFLVWPDIQFHYLVICQAHVFIGFLHLTDHLQLQPPELHFPLLVETFLVTFLLPEAFALLRGEREALLTGLMPYQACLTLGYYVLQENSVLENEECLRYFIELHQKYLANTFRERSRAGRRDM